MSNWNDANYDDVQESKDFGAIKPTTTRLRVRDVKEETVEGSTYGSVVKLFTEFVEPDAVEPYDVNESPSAPIVNLYNHTPGARGMLKRTLEAHGIDYEEFKGAGDKLEFLRERLVGAEADAKITVALKNKKTGEDLKRPRNEVSYIVNANA